jgi:hypothetical protein
MLTECFWSFYNEKTKTRIDGLKSLQALAIAKVIKKEQLVDWIVWKEGQSNWQPISAFPELFTRSDEPEPGSFATDVESHIENNFEKNLAELEKTNPTLVLEKEGFYDVRLQNRFKKELAATIVSPEKKFERVTENISLGGMKLKESLPNWLGGKIVKVVITFKGTTWKGACCVIPEPDRLVVNRLIIVENKQVDLLRSWLL